MNIFIVSTIVIIVNITIIVIFIIEEIEIFTKRNYFATRCVFDTTGRIINILFFLFILSRNQNVSNILSNLVEIC